LHETAKRNRGKIRNNHAV